MNPSIIELAKYNKDTERALLLIKIKRNRKEAGEIKSIFSRMKWFEQKYYTSGSDSFEDFDIKEHNKQYESINK